MGYLSFPENLMIIPGSAPVEGAAAEVTSLPISLKNVQKLWAVVYLNTAGTAGAVACVPQTDALVAFGSAAVLVHTVPIWSNQDCAANDEWTQETDAVNLTTTADAHHKMVVFEIDPSNFRTAAAASSDDDCFRISLTAVAATDYSAIFYIIQPRYPSSVASQATYITD
jgi:hypothetical protein